VQGAFGSTGQRCTATSRAVIVDSVADAFVEKIACTRWAKLKVGNGLEAGVDMGPSVIEAQLNKVLSYHDVAKDRGRTAGLGGQRLSGRRLAHGYYSAPTVYDTCMRTRASAWRRSSVRCCR
jgi:acyl-CoA reductase-like NAD-dependent aldehyde dehydrogenase